MQYKYFVAVSLKYMIKATTKKKKKKNRAIGTNAKIEYFSFRTYIFDCDIFGIEV